MAEMVLVQSQAIRELDTLRASWVGARSVGLMQNAGPVQTTWTLADILPCNFSGYVGVIPAVAWSAAVMLGEWALTRAALLQWTHNGGPVGNWVTGYYVVNQLGQLAWAKISSEGPRAMVSLGQRYVVRPEFTLKSRFPTD